MDHKTPPQDDFTSYSRGDFPIRETTEYVNWHAVWGVLIVAVVVTVGAITYGLKAGGSLKDVDAAVDRVAVQKDLTPCQEIEGASDCFARSFHLVPADKSCPRVLDLAVQTTCTNYFTALDALRTRSEQMRKPFTYEQIRVEVTFQDGTTKSFKTVVADTDPKRIQGLSYTQSMAADEAMLFAFPAEMPQMSFHMKDMLLPLDIVYLTQDFVPVQSFRNLASCAGFPGQSCPLLTREGGDVQYVLEILPQGKEAIGVKVLEA